jgi:hypothetical protein
LKAIRKILKEGKRIWVKSNGNLWEIRRLSLESIQYGLVRNRRSWFAKSLLTIKRKLESSTRSLRSSSLRSTGTPIGSRSSETRHSRSTSSRRVTYDPLNYLTGEKREGLFVTGNCPRCGGKLPYGEQGPLSLRDRKTELCRCCFRMELLDDFKRELNDALSRQKGKILRRNHGKHEGTDSKGNGSHR